MKTVQTLLVALAAFCAGCTVWSVNVRTEGEKLHFDLREGMTMTLVRIPPGSFLMGSPETEKDRRDNEGPQHEVTITKPFYMGTGEVTQAEWKAVIGTEPWSWMTKNNPACAASHISWDDATAFCRRLSRLTGRAVRLPTEAEWAYACRAGTSTRFWYGDDPDYSDLGKYARYAGNTTARDENWAHRGRWKPNAWGLCDMHGNVWEWCSDWYSSYASAKAVDPQGPATGTSRVLRGGYWSSGGGCRSARRQGCDPRARGPTLGFRIVVSAEGED